MKALKVWGCVAVLAAGGMLTWQAVAEDAPANAVAKKEPRGRLPAQYGKLGLSDEIKDELYQIDTEYDTKIDVLAAEIKELQIERDAKMQLKLTEAQRTQLKTLRDEASAKRAAQKAKTESGPAAEGVKTPEVEAKPAAKKP